MDGILNLDLPATTMKRINACRLWLQVTILSDISNLKGDQITQAAWLRLAQIPSNDSDWPVQGRPHNTVWGIWRKALSDTFCMKDSRYVLASRPGGLTQSLGVWLHDLFPQ